MVECTLFLQSSQPLSQEANCRLLFTHPPSALCLRKVAVALSCYLFRTRCDSQVACIVDRLCCKCPNYKMIFFNITINKRGCDDEEEGDERQEI